MILELRLPKSSYDDATTFVTTEAGVQGLRERPREARMLIWNSLTARSAMFDLTPVVIEMAGFGPPVPPADDDRI